MNLSVAEKERLNLLNPPERTPELFEEFLPYAIALGVENKWGDQFTSIFSKFNHEDGQYYPKWYHGHSMSRFGIADFSKKYNIKWGKGIDTDNWLTRNWPELIKYVENPPYEIDEITVSAAIYKGKESVSLRETSGR